MKLRRPTTPRAKTDAEGARVDAVAADLARDPRWEADDVEDPPRRPSTRPAALLASDAPPGRSKLSGEFDRPPVVLVVDDRPENCDLYREYLTYAGFRVIEAHDGQEAVACALEQRPDAVIMDISMPVMDGYVATRLIKGDLRTRHIPVVIVTASGAGCHHDATSAGCDAFLLKPCMPEDLEGVIRTCILLNAKRPALRAVSA